MAETAAPAEPKPETSERVFRRRLFGALKKGNVRELGAMWKDDLLEPHMHLFVLLVAAFGVGLMVLILEPMFV